MGLFRLLIEFTECRSGWVRVTVHFSEAGLACVRRRASRSYVSGLRLEISGVSRAKTDPGARPDALVLVIREQLGTESMKDSLG